MRAQLEALEKLAGADLAQRQIDIELGDLQHRTETLRADVERLRELLERERQLAAEAEKARLTHLGELEAIADKTARSKKRSDSARNNREAEATQRELEVLRREKEERTAEMTRQAELATQMRASIEKHEQDVAGLGDVLREEETVASRRREELLGRRRSAEEERRSLAQHVRADLLRTYSLVASKRGSGVAECHGGICRGCNMSLPPQLFNQIITVDKVYQCPSCQRILLARPGR